MRVDAVLLVSLALIFGAVFAVEPAAATAAVLSIALLVARRAPALTLICVAAALALTAWRASSALGRYEARRIEARDALGAPSRCAGTAVIVASPTWRGDATTYLADFAALECEGRPMPLPLRARLYGGPGDLRRGDRLELVAQLAPVRTFRNPGLADPTPFVARNGSVLSGMVLGAEVVERGGGLFGGVDAARAHVRRRILRTFAPEAAGMARALVLGESDLSAEDDEAFRKSGLSHLLAVSGTHLVFAVVALINALAFVLARIELLAARWDVGRIAAAIGIPLALGYADFAGGSGSAWRAAWMLAVAFAARAFGRRPAARRAFALSLVIGAVVDPLAAFDVSFQLSALATAGLLVLGPSMMRLLRAEPAAGAGPFRRFCKLIAASVAATVSSMVPCTPVLLGMSPEVTLAGVVANVIAAPVGELVALPVCLTHALLAPLPLVERGAALLGSGALLVVKAVAHASAAARFLAIPLPPPSAWQLVVLSVGALGVLLRAQRAIWAGATALAIVALELAAVRAGRPLGELRVTTLDVGQGDASLVDLPDGTLMLVDAGGFVGSPVDPGRSVILPMLRVRRRERIDVVVLSHPHPDHFGGLPSVARGVPVGELWDTGQGEAEGAGPVYRGLLEDARARGVRVVRPRDVCGRKMLGGAELSVLAPCPGFVPRRDANDNSWVVKLKHGRRAVLLTGDAEAEAEKELLQHHRAALRADLLKVGHHGSRTSTSAEFLAAVSPEVATISCGVRNRFGHPHRETLATLAGAGVLPLRLDRTGGAVWTTDGESVRIGLFQAAR